MSRLRRFKSRGLWPILISAQEKLSRIQRNSRPDFSSDPSLGKSRTMRALENITYDELHVGDYATFTKTLTEEELILFAAASGDVNPCSIDAKTVNAKNFNKHIGHGMW